MLCSSGDLPSRDEDELSYGDCISLNFLADTRTLIETVGVVLGVVNAFSLLVEVLVELRLLMSRLVYSVKSLLPPSMS